MRRIAWALAAAVVAAASPAAAETDDAKATQLFEEAVALRETNLELACQKFEQALAYNPLATGILLNVALCDERFGRVASAARRFAEARARAAELGRSGTKGVADTIKAADEHLTKLRPDIPHLALQFTERPPDLVLSIDGAPIPLGDGLSLELEIDPGERTLVVTAPGRAAYQSRLAIAKAERRELTIPRLARASNSRRTIGKLTAIGGAAAIGTSAALALFAYRRYNGPFDDGRCHDGVCDTPAAQSQVESARTLGNVATVTAIVGLVVTGAGTYLWLRARREPERKLSLGPHLAPGLALVTATGRF